MKPFGAFPDRIYVLAAALAVAALILALAIAESIGGESNQPLSAAPSIDHVRAVDDALAAGDAGATRSALERAYTAALGTRRWEAMLEVGNAARRAGDLPGARRAWPAALVRARQAGAVDGTLAVAEAFADVGDHSVAGQCFGIARDLARRDGDPRALSHVSVLTERFNMRGSASGMEP